MRSSLLAALAAALLAACGAGDKNDNVEPVCVAGAMQCSDALAAVETCKADGSGWEVTQECMAGAVCQDRKCRCPGTKVPSAGGCVQVGVTECPDGFVLEENGCAVKPGACGAGEIISIGKCTKVGIQQCAEGWDADADTGGCVVAEKGCGEGKEWIIGTGCLGFGPKL